MQMAKSPAHRFGQIIGDLLEHTLIRYCAPIAAEYGMYLDYKHARPARNHQSEVRWKDINGNTHKLDIVIEANGSETKTGRPRAFIEMAWRRYTKHSKNKAQEISAAIRPLVSRYSELSPFYGAVLAGEFTQNSLNQMRSEGFTLLYFSLDAIEDAFASQGIDAHWDEDTAEQELQHRVDQLEALPEEDLQSIGDYLMERNGSQWEEFQQSLRCALARTIQRVSITELYGSAQQFNSARAARDYIASDHQSVPNVFYGYEVTVKYSNGDHSKMQFKDKKEALASLKRLI